MPQAVRDLTVDQLRMFIEETVHRAIDDRLEDFRALGSPSYLASIEQARDDLRSGKGISLEDLLDDSAG